MNAQIRVAIYARVSTAEQAEEGYSIDAQVDNIKQQCIRDGKIVVAVYADKGISGKSMANRIDLHRLISDSKKGLFDEVHVWKTSRLARNIVDLLQIVKELQYNNVAFKSITEPYDTSTSTGQLTMTLLASIAEFERTTIIENLKMGMSARAKDGLKNGGKMLGYRSEGSGKESKLVIVPEEAELVKKIFHMYLSGKGFRAIANALNKEGYKTVKGAFHSTTGIKGILKNPTYAGKITFNKLVDYSTKRRAGKNDNFILADGQHEAIISLDTWEQVQEIIKGKNKGYPNESTGKYPLSGILVCPVCGYKMVAGNTISRRKDGTKITTRLYVCGQFRTKGAVVCKANSIKADLAEKYVFDRINDILTNEKILKDLVEKLNATRENAIAPLTIESTKIQKDIASYTQKKDRIFELYEDGMIDKNVLNQRLISAEETITRLAARQASIIQELQINGSDKIPYVVVKNAMSDFKRLLDTADVDQRKTFLQLIMTKITIKDSKSIDTIQIHFNHSLQGIVRNYLGEDSSSEEDEGSSFTFTINI